MKLANTIFFRTFCMPEEDKEKIKNAFITLLGYTEEEMIQEKINFIEKKAKGFQEKTIIMFEATLSKDKHCNKFLSRLSEELSDDDRELLLSQTNRLDDHLNFFIRLDKESYLNNEWLLTDSGNCFHIKINIAAFPRRKDVAFKVVRSIFG